MDYLIQLPTGKYLCHEGTDRAVVYGHYATNLSFDLALTKGRLVPVTRKVFAKVFMGTEYSNTIEGDAQILEELHEAFISGQNAADARDGNA